METVEVRRKHGRAEGHRPMPEGNVLVIRAGKGRGISFVTPDGEIPVEPTRLRMVEDAVTLHRDPTAEPGPDNPSVTVVEHVLAALYVCGIENAEIEVRGEPGYSEHVWRVDCRIDDVVRALDGPGDPPDPEGTDPAVTRFHVEEGELPSVVRNVAGTARPSTGSEHVSVKISGEPVDPTDPRTVTRGAVSNKTPEHAALDVVADVFMLMRTSGVELELDRPTTATSVHPTDVCLSCAVKPGHRILAVSVEGRYTGATNVEPGEPLTFGCDPGCDVFTSETPTGTFTVRNVAFEPHETGSWTPVNEGAVHVGDPIEPEG